MEGTSLNSGSGSHSTGRGRSEADDGDSKPPSLRQNRPANNLRLNTPQPEEGPGQAGTPASGVAALPQRSTGGDDAAVIGVNWIGGGDTVIGYTEDGPIRASRKSSASPTPAARYTSPSTASSERTGRSTSSPTPARTGPTTSSPRVSSAPRHQTAAALAAGVPAATTTSAQRSSGDRVTAATGIPEIASTSAETSESSKEASRSIPKKYLYWGGAVFAAVVIALVAVVVVVVTSNNDDPAPAPDPAQDSPASSPGGSPTSSPGPPADGPTDQTPVLTLATVAQRGSLNCGISLQPGFGSVSNGEYSGFDADLCRAVAAGIFGADTAVNFTRVEPATRFKTLQEKEVDVLAGTTTYTMERNVHEAATGVGYSFSTPYFYAGLGFAGLPPFGACADQLNVIDDACVGLKVCVIDGTTHVDRVNELLPGAAIILSPNIEAYYATFGDGLCNVLAGEPAEISEDVVRNAGYVGEYEVGTNVYSKEPLALVTRNGDAEFSDFVNWIVQALMAAEEQDITQSTAGAFTQSTLFGEEYQDMFINAIEAVGNYAEVYDRNLEAIIPRASINTINQGDTGLVYALPFGAFTIEGPGPSSGGTLDTIIQRGHLRCGITRRAVFAEFDTDGQEWRGLDVDFCKAVSAAIFSGVTSTIVYTVLPATERFVALEEGSVDLLARITTATMERDVLEPNAAAGFTFSQPNFYDGLSFGGIPPYGQCADNLDVTSTGCQDLLICVNDGTTFLERLKQLLPERYLAPQQTGELAIQGLAAGLCNAIAGGVQDVSPTSVVEVGEYTGAYENGVNRFSKDPLALVTRQDDPQWSAFVFWIVSSIFYAEEEGITQSTATSMPTLNLFGPLYSRMLRDVIEAVGSYGEIYDRNAEAQIPRGGLNLLNVNPFGPQHYPYPGL